MQEVEKALIDKQIQTKKTRNQIQTKKNEKSDSNAKTEKITFS